MNLIFIGQVYFSYEILIVLIKLRKQFKSINLTVITSEKNNFNSDFKNLLPICKKNNIEFHITGDINSKETTTWIKKNNPDVILCCGWSRLLKKKVLKIPKIGVVGYHPASLPNNKGRHPIIWSIALGLKETASSFFMMSEYADSGKVISQEKIKINNDNAYILYKKIIKVAKLQIKKIIIDLLNDKISFVRVKTHKKGNTWRKRSYLDGQIDWRMSAGSIKDLVNALSFPYPGAHFIHKKKVHKLLSVSIIKSKKYLNIEPGKVVFFDKLNRPVIKCGKDLLKLYKVTPKPNFKINDYL